MTTGAARMVRRIVLGLAALVFAGIAVASLVAPRTMAEPFGYALDTVNGLSEFRAIYVGLWLAQAVIFLWAARRIDQVWLGDVCALLVGGQVLGRIISVALDGVPDMRILPLSIVEAVGAVVIALARPTATRS